MKNLLFIGLLLMAPMTGMSQQGNDAHGHEGHHYDDDASALQVFSDNGELFFLVINGVNQNSKPVSNIRVQGLPQVGTDVQILFADNHTPGTGQRIVIADPIDGRPVTMSLKIVRNREGFAKLRFVSCTGFDRDNRTRGNEFVINYIRQQHGGEMDQGREHEDRAPLPAGPTAMDAKTFGEAKHTIANASFDDTKLSTAKTIASANYFTTDQVMAICRLFSFDDGRLDFAKYAYPRTIDQNNYFKVSTVFSFDADKQALMDFISNARK